MVRAVVRSGMLIGLVLGAVGLLVLVGSGPRRAAALRLDSSITPTATFVAGSTRQICGPTGLTGHDETETASSYGLDAGDRGYSFEYDGNVWWLFGDSMPSKKAPWGAENASHRYPGTKVGPNGLDNDSIAYSPLTTAETCPIALTYETGGAPVSGAYANPEVTPDPWSGTGQMPLQTNESPIAGITENQQMYVVFATDDPEDPSPPKHDFGDTTRSVMAVLFNKSTLQFTGLYDLSAPSVRDAAGAKFVHVAMQPGTDGYVYIWGTAGGGSNAYLARIPAADIGDATSAYPRGPADIQYWDGTAFVGPASGPDPESVATPLFSDSPACMNEIGVQYNPYLGLWLMLYNCKDDTPLPAGIWMRTAPAPQGPWSEPQTIFNPLPDATAQTGYCYFIHSVRNFGPKCPVGATNPPKKGAPQGTYYGPFFVADWMTGTYATATQRSSSNIYYTLDTYSPYGQVILRSTIEGSTSLSGSPGKPPCHGTTCT